MKPTNAAVDCGDHVFSGSLDLGGGHSDQPGPRMPGIIGISNIEIFGSLRPSDGRLCGWPASGLPAGC